MIDPRRASVSVLIGLVSTEDRERILETLASLDERQGDVACEVILADRRQDDVSRRIADLYPSVRIIPCPSPTTLPEMRAIALDAANSEIVCVTEDHCVPVEGWLGEILSAMKDGNVIAAGGCVENGVRDTPLDWATFLCEYSAFSPPVVEGTTTVLPGMNVAYRRHALTALPRSKLVEGFWETTAHHLLTERGGIFVSRNSIKMLHCKKFSFGLFARQRYVYSRYYAGLRFGPEQLLHRLVASAATILLPLLLIWRMRGAASAKGLAREFWAALPTLLAFVVIWSVGEGVGYLAGAGNALEEIE